MATFGNVEEQLAPDPVEKVALPTSRRKLKPGLTISNLAAEVFSVRFSPDGRYLAAGCGDGAVRIFNAKTGTASAQLTSSTAAGLPTTVIRFRPHDNDRTKNVLLAANANGGRLSRGRSGICRVVQALTMVDLAILRSFKYLF